MQSQEGLSRQQTYLQRYVRDMMQAQDYDVKLLVDLHIFGSPLYQWFAIPGLDIAKSLPQWKHLLVKVEKLFQLPSIHKVQWDDGLSQLTIATLEHPQRHRVSRPPDTRASQREKKNSRNRPSASIKAAIRSLQGPTAGH